ncbi:MAG: SH3 domain-containing protein, partial [Chloroflexota bacterium]|nr:SH3 domain-containing protein [Chloroflexota bacterium]
AASPDDADLIRRRAAIHGKRQQLWAAPGVTEALGISAVGVERARTMPVERPWAADDQVGAAGVEARTAPDPTRAPATRIPPGTTLQVLMALGDWAQVRAYRGWSGWVDGRSLVALPARPKVHWR